MIPKIMGKCFSEKGKYVVHIIVLTILIVSSSGNSNEIELRREKKIQ